MRNSYTKVYLIVLSIFAFPNVAHAYLDPATGTLILQGIAAAVVSGLVFWKTIKEKVARLLNKKKKNE